MAESRKAIHAYLTPTSHRVWHRIADEAGVSLSGLLEALAADMGADPPDRGGHPRWSKVLQEARRVDARRRRRSRYDPDEEIDLREPTTAA